MKMRRRMCEDHEATCVCCEHAHFDAGCEGWSEWTPPEQGAWECRKGHWDAYALTGPPMHDVLQMAQLCQDWEPRLKTAGQPGD